MASKVAQFMLNLILALLAVMSIPTITNIIHHLIFGKDENKKKSMKKPNTQNPKVTKDEEIEDKKESNPSNTNCPKPINYKIIQVNRIGARLMKDTVRFGAAKSYISITNYVKRRIKGDNYTNASDLEYDIYSMTYNKTNNKITSFDARAAERNEYVQFDHSTQRMTQIKRRNVMDKYVTTFTKQLKVGSIHCVMVKMINIVGDYKGKKNGVYLGITGCKQDKRVSNIDYPIESPGNYFFSVKGNYYFRRGRINLDGFEINNQDVIKMVADLHSGIISFINMTKYIQTGHVKCCAFPINKQLPYRFTVATLRKGDEYQIISDTNEILSSRDSINSSEILSGRRVPLAA